MGFKWDENDFRWIPKEQPLSRPRRTLSRQTLLRGLVEEIVYEDSIAALYASLLANVICDGHPAARNKFEHMLTLERREQKQSTVG
jgi:hypothetical protein